MQAASTRMFQPKLRLSKDVSGKPTRKQISDALETGEKLHAEIDDEEEILDDARVGKKRVMETSDLQESQESKSGGQEGACTRSFFQTKRKRQGCSKVSFCLETEEENKWIASST